jgi:hypothetical protein
MDYLLSSEGTELSSPSSIRNGSYANFLDDFSVTMEQEEEHSDDTPKTIVCRKAPALHQESTEVAEGEARRIWQHIRRTSRRGQQPQMSQDSYIDAHDEVEQHEPDLEQIRETARKHGRKISSKTLRNLARDFRRLNPSFGDEFKDDGESCTVFKMRT